MAPSRVSLLPSSSRRTRSLDRERHDVRWGDRSITAPTYQKPNVEPIIAPAEWASPATTLVDSSPEIGSEKAVSPVDHRSVPRRNALTITIPLPWKRKSRSCRSPRDPLPSARLPPPTPSEHFRSSQDTASPVMADAMKPQRNADLVRAQLETRSAIEQYTMRSARTVATTRTLDLKSPMFPLSPLQRDAPRPLRNVDLLNSELEAISLNRTERSKPSVDDSISPIDAPPARGLAEATQSQRTGTLEQLRTPAPTLTPMVTQFARTDARRQPASAGDPYYRSPIEYTPMEGRAGGHNAIKVLTPVEEMHERNSQASPSTMHGSGQASPTSPNGPGYKPSSLSAVACSPIDSTDPRLVQYAYVVDPAAALGSHPTSLLSPRARSSDRYDTKRLTSRARPCAMRASSLDPAPRRSVARRPPVPVATNSIRRTLRRSGDFTINSRTPASTEKPPQVKFATYQNRRSRSMEPTPSPRLIIDPARSPSVTSVSSGSTDVDSGEPTSEDDALFSPKDAEKYFEARQNWNGVAGEGKKGFYRNVMDDYKMIGKDVSTPIVTEIQNKPEMLTKKTVNDGKVKIAGLDAPMAELGGSQALVPSADELWG